MISEQNVTGSETEGEGPECIEYLVLREEEKRCKVHVKQKRDRGTGERVQGKDTVRVAGVKK